MSLPMNINIAKRQVFYYSLMNTTKFQDEVINEQNSNMTPFGIATLLTKLGLRMKTGPAKDRINEEEQLAMIDFILQNPISCAYLLNI